MNNASPTHPDHLRSSVIFNEAYYKGSLAPSTQRLKRFSVESFADRLIFERVLHRRRAACRRRCCNLDGQSELLNDQAIFVDG